MLKPAHIQRIILKAASSTVQTAPNFASHSDEIICSFFAQQASMPTTHDDEDLLQIDEDAMEEIDIRWQVAMITARIRKFMRKTGRPIDLKPKNGITFDKSKIECFNCQNLGHFARECRFAKYQENRANGRQEKRIVAIKDSNSKALVATDNNEDIDWTKEFDAEPSLSRKNMYFGQDGLGNFDWSNKADDTPVSLALMATNSEVSLIQRFTSGKDESTARPKWTQTVPSKSTADVFYQDLEPQVFSRTLSIPKDQENCENLLGKEGSSVGSQGSTSTTVQESAMIKSNQTWRPKGNYLDSVNRNNGSYTLKQFEYVTPLGRSKDYAIIDSGCSGSMTGDKDKLSDFKEFKGGYVAFGNDSKGGRISGKGTIKTSCLDFEKVSYVEELKFNLLSVSQICDKKHNVLFTDKECLILSPTFKFVDEDLVILQAPRKNDVYSLDLKNIISLWWNNLFGCIGNKGEAVLWARRLGHVNFKNINKLVKGNLVRGLPSKTFKLDHSCLACRKGKQHRASCKKD
ncbi:putative ribonuclease H-like domain-containing protein [Tanacetum coccineum]